MKDLPTRILTAIVFGILVIGSLLIDPYVFMGVMYLFAILAGFEWFKLTGTQYKKLSILYYWIGTTVVFFSYGLYLTQEHLLQNLEGIKLFFLLIFLLPIYVFPLLGIIDVVINKSNNIQYLIGIFFPFFFIAIPLFILSIIPFLLLRQSQNMSHMFYFFAVIWTYDTMAYFIGSLWGRKKLAPTISPAKTWEGLIGGFIVTLIIFLILKNVFFNNFNLLFYAMSLIILMISATFGDLFESKIKRNAGVKDSGTIFPGHGGVLDRLDSVFFASPFYFVLLILSFVS